jgi:hypothetical protein
LLAPVIVVAPEPAKITGPLFVKVLEKVKVAVLLNVTSVETITGPANVMGLVPEMVCELVLNE